jgi:hypothetical protein
MSSCILSSRNNNNKSNQQDYNEVEEILNQGIEKIYHSFSINNKIYKEKITEDENIINSLTKKLEMLKNEIEMIQRENQYYKSQNEKLKKEVEKLNKIVNNIRGKLTSVDLQINECIKNDNIKTNLKKNFDTNQKKKNSLYINFSNRDGSESFFRLNTKKFLDEEKNGNYNNKSIKNKKLLYYMDNSNNTKDNGNKLDNVKENINNTAETKKKCNKTVGYNSFDLNIDLNDNDNINNIGKKEEKMKNQNSVLYKNIISREEKKKKKNLEMTTEQPRDTSTSCQDNNKNRSYSSKQFVKDNNAITTNKTTEVIEAYHEFNNEDLNVDKFLNNSKGIEGKICLTYDNLFNKMNTRKKNSYTSFRGKILNKNISEHIFKNYSHRRNQVDQNISSAIADKITKAKNDEITFFLRKCKILLDKEAFESIVKLFQEYKDGLLTDEGIILKTENYLENNKELIDIFNKVFGK